MSPKRIAVPVLLLVIGLAGCATPIAGAAAPAESSPAPIVEESTASVSDDVDAAGDMTSTGIGDQLPADDPASVTVQAWLDGAVVPPGAERIDTPPEGVTFYSYQGWPCSPMANRVGYWSVDSMTLAEADAWMATHPTADLMVVPSAEQRQPVSDDIDATMISEIPELGSLSGIAYTLMRSPTGVVIRAEMGVLGETSVCPTGNWGSPGQG